MRAFVSILLAAAAMRAVAADAPSEERDRLVAQRQAIEQRYAAERADCADRFAVSSCMEEARLRRRDALAALQKQEAVLALQERQAAAERRRQDILAKSATGTRRVGVAASAPASAASAASRASRAVPAPAPKQDPTALTPQSSSGEGERTAQERRARTVYEQRQRDAEAHRQQVEQRNAERAARGRKPAAPLPVPSAAASR